MHLWVLSGRGENAAYPPPSRTVILAILVSLYLNNEKDQPELRVSLLFQWLFLALNTWNYRSSSQFHGTGYHTLFLILFHCLPRIHILLLFLIVVQVQLSPFPPDQSPLPHPPPTLNPTPLWLCPWVLHTIPWQPFPFFPLYPSPLPSVSLFFISVTQVIFLLVCLFCSLSSTYRWDHMVFVPHRLAYFT